MHAKSSLSHPFSPGYVENEAASQEERNTYLASLSEQLTKGLPV